MSMCRAELENAFRETVTKEFAFIPLNEEDIDYTFSSFFEKRMENLIRAQKKAYYSFTNTALKKVAVICAALITLLLAACSVEQVRKPIVNFFTEIFDDSIRYFVKGDTVNSITEEYSIKALPEGFDLVNYSKGANELFYEFKYNLGEKIFFTQMITSSSDISFDNEHGKIYTKQINGKAIEIYESPYSKQAIWIENRYMMHIVCYGNIEMNTLEFLIKSVGLN